MHQVLKDAGGEDFLATTALAGWLLCMAVGIGAEGINLAAALRAQDDELSPSSRSRSSRSRRSSGRSPHGRRAGSVRAGDRRGRAANARRPAALARRSRTAVVGVLLLTPLAHVNWFAGAALMLLAALIGAALIRTPARTP